MSTIYRRRRKRSKAEIELELAKLDVLCRQYEAEDRRRQTVTDDTIRNWKNKREYVI